MLPRVFPRASAQGYVSARPVAAMPARSFSRARAFASPSNVEALIPACGFQRGPRRLCVGSLHIPSEEERPSPKTTVSHKGTLGQ